ncbi:reverse transcriptase domain-containing protein [Tanacetum coccineum]
MAASDEEKTAFHTSHGVYFYTKMPFGLKNAGATYQRLVDKAFDIQVRWNIEVYVDDLVIKSHTEAEMLRDIDETFRTLRKINMKVNPKKCTFKAVEGMFLGYMISPEGIKPCPDKTEAVLQLPSPQTIKEVLADFLIEKSDESLPDTSVVETPQESWTLFTDGSSCVDGSDAGLILTSPEGTEFTYALRFQFTTFNNEAEYEALIAGLRITAQMGVRNVHVSVDSKLVANQVLRTYVAKEENMVKYLEKAKSLISGFANFSISQVPRRKNKKANALSKIASTSFAHLSKQVLLKILKEKSIQEEEVATVVEEEGPTWMTLIMEYLKKGTLPGDRNEASKLRIKARRYELLEVVLYRRSFLKPWLRYVGPLQAEYVIREIHEGSCKAVILAEIGMPTYRTAVVDVAHNDEELRLNLDLLEERRERAAIREAKAKLKMTKYYNARVCGVTFRPRDFVYHGNDASHAVDGGKLGPKWEGPYEVTEALGDGAYRLRSMDGMVLPRTWNIANLKKCYL